MFNRLSRLSFTVVLLWVMSITVAAQTATPPSLPPSDGLDVVFILENSSRTTSVDAQELQVEAVRFALHQLVVDAFLFNPGVQHKATVITYAGNAETVSSLIFGPYGTNGITNPTAESTYTEDLTRIAALTTRRSSAPNTDSLENGVPPLVSEAFANTSQNRSRQVIHLGVGSPQNAEPDAVITRFMDRIVPLLTNQRMDILILPYPNTSFGPQPDIWQRERGALMGTEVVLESLEATLPAIAKVINEPLAALRGAKGITVVEVPIEGGSLELPPFVSSVSFVGFDDQRFTVTTPSSVPTGGNFHGLSAQIVSYANPPAGRYTFSGSENITAFIRIGRAELNTSDSLIQLGESQLTASVFNLFGQPFDYGSTFQPPVNIVVTHEKGEWRLPMSSDGKSGALVRRFVPPYSGSYTYRLDFAPTVGQKTATLQGGDVERSLNATPLRLVQNGGISTELYQPINITISVEDTNGATLFGDPEVVLTTPTTMEPVNPILSLGGQTSVTLSGATFASMQPSPALLRAQLYASLPDQPDKNGLSNYLVIGDTDFPITVTRPVVDARLTSENIMLESIDLAAASTTLTRNILSDFAVELCADFSQTGASSPLISTALSGLAGEYNTNVFQPRTSGTYSYRLAIRPDCASPAGEVVAWDSVSFEVDELVLGFIKDNQAIAIPTLQQFVEFETEIGLFRGTNSLQRYTGNLAVTPILSFDAPFDQNGQVSSYNAESDSYKVTLLSRIDTPQSLAISAVAPDDQPLTLRFYDGNTVVNPALSVQTTPATLTLTFEQNDTQSERTSLRQFDVARLTLNLTSTQDDTTFDALDFQQQGGTAVATLTTDDDTWEVPLSFDSSLNRFSAPIPLATGGTYRFGVRLTLQDEISVFDDDFDPQTVGRLHLEQTSDTPREIGEETEQTFTFVWLDEQNTPVIEVFANPPTMMIDQHSTSTSATLIEIIPVEGEYRLNEAFGTGSSGQYQFTTQWNAKAPDQTTYQNPPELFNLTVGDVEPFYLDLEGTAEQEFFTPILPFVRTNIRTERELVYEVVVRPAIDATTPDRTRHLPISEVFVTPTQAAFDLLVRDANVEGSCGLSTSTLETDCTVRPQDWSWVVNPDGQTATVTLRGISEGHAYDIQLRLRDRNAVSQGYNLRQPLTIDPLIGTLIISPYTTSFPIWFLVGTLVSTLVIIAVWLLLRRRRDSQRPWLENYIWFGQHNTQIPRSYKDMSEWRRNRVDLRRSDLWEAQFDLERVVIERSSENPTDIVVKYWRKSPETQRQRRLKWFTLEQINPPTAVTVKLDDKCQLIPDHPEFIYYASRLPNTGPQSKLNIDPMALGKHDKKQPTVPQPIPTTPKPKDPAPESQPHNQSPTISPKPQPSAATLPIASPPPPSIPESIPLPPGVPDSSPLPPPPPPPTNIPDSKPMTPPPSKRLLSDEDDDPFAP